MSYSAEQVQILTQLCEQFRGSKAPDGYPDSLALCIVDSVQSTMVRYPTVEKVVNNYRAYRRARGGDPNTDSAVDLTATFAQLKGHEAWAERIGNGNRTSTHRGAPLKAYAIEAEANGMIGVGVVTTQDLRSAAEDTDALARVKKAWLKVPGQGPGVTWHYSPDACGNSWDQAGPDDHPLRRKDSRLSGQDRRSVFLRRATHRRRGRASHDGE